MRCLRPVSEDGVCARCLVGLVGRSFSLILFSLVGVRPVEGVAEHPGERLREFVCKVRPCTGGGLGRVFEAHLAR